MTERWTTTQAAEWCGIRPGTFRDYVSEGYAPAPLPERDLETGAKLYDADAVKAWHAARPGPGSRTDLGRRGAGVGQTDHNRLRNRTDERGGDSTSDQG